MRPLALVALAALCAASVQGDGAAPAPPPPATGEPLIPPAALDDTLDVAGEAMHARRIGTRMAVAAKVDGQGPFRFIVDTAADRSVIGLALARRLALPVGPVVTLHGMAGAEPVATVRIARLDVGARSIADVVAPALAEEYLGAPGLIGLDALAGQRLMLDFVGKTIRIEDPRAPPPPEEEAEIVVTARRRFGQLILTQVMVGRERVQAVIDTGTEVTIGNSALRARLLRGRSPPPVRPVVLTSVTGQAVTADLALLPPISIGTLGIERVTIAFADVPPFALFGLADRPAMLLGTDVLEAFSRVSLDFSRRKVRFQLRR